jgi:hypothetical protein
MAAETFVETLERLYFFEQPKLESRFRKLNTRCEVQVSKLEKTVCESAAGCGRVLRFLRAEIQINWRK